MITNQYVREVQLKRDEVPSFKEYPFSLPAIRHLSSLELPGNNL
jgi:predicted ATPase